MSTTVMLPSQYCVSVAKLTKNMFAYQSQRTVMHFMQIMRPVTYTSYRRNCFVTMAYAWRTMRYRDEHVALLWRIVLTCNELTSFLPGLTLVIFVLEVKIHAKPTRSHCVSSDHAAIGLRTCCVTSDRATYLRALLSIARHTCAVCMANRSCYELSAIF